MQRIWRVAVLSVDRSEVQEQGIAARVAAEMKG